MSVLEREEVDNEILRLTLNRPEKLNALNVELLSAVVDALEGANGDYRVVVVEGAGRAFTSGADLDEASVGSERIGLFQEMTRAARAFEGLVIGKLHGHVVGGGFEFTLSFDLRYAETETTFLLTESEIGVTLSNASTKLLPLMIGHGRARELVFTGRPLDAAEAEELGLLAGVYEANELEQEVMEAAHDIVENKSETAVALNKRLFNHAFPVEDNLAYEELINVKCRERIEGIQWDD